MIVSISEAKTRLSELLDLMAEGEDIIITRNGRRVARLVRAEATVKPRFGAMRGEITWREGWEKSMTARETDAFWDGRSLKDRGP